jgi:HlyD family secretion protein
VNLAAQRLALLDGQPSPAAVAAARVDLAKAMAELDALQRVPNPPAVRAAELAVALGKTKLAQFLLPAKPAVRNAARLDVAKARADLETLRRRGAPANANDLAIARLKVETARTHLALADAQAARLAVRAPASGTITAVLAAPGAPADAVTPVVTIADLAHLAVRVDLSEFDVARVHAGLPAVVSVDALGGRTLPGKVIFEALTGVDNGGVVTFPVRVEMARVANVKPGMNASVRIIVARRRHVVQVPLEAVSRDGNGHTLVTILSASGKTSTRRVWLGLADNKNVEVKRGLHPGERVVLGGGQGA